ncbi:hypothetical protein ASE86_01345 [Sphingomonas sp. Leaf33]|uniref:hypothetical protein n=1 Tax=Sphingomonas sp. Leaf33 TaxID=1736215 RepID=UPI0006FAF8C6|nr:hypothetical protein [Sphingomonas sp. Leaf33]KQN24952.1 hypothetical protein ASE86_01345 [Sphingomonas sp. Leaf33]
MKHDPAIAPGPDTDAAEIVKAKADLAAGIGVSHAVVSRWLMTWGTDDRRPFREWLAAQDG